MQAPTYAVLLLAATLCALPLPAQPGGGQSGPRPGNGSGRGERLSPSLSGEITALADGQFTVKAETGQSLTVRLTAETRFVTQTTMPQRAVGEQTRQKAEGERPRTEFDRPQTVGPARQSLQATDFKIGDTIAAMGALDAASATVTATMVMKLDPERARQMRELQASFGKTWLAGKVTAIDELTLTLQGTADNAPHAFTVDENTSFRKRNEPITLADFQTGDSVRIEGSINDGVFVATSVTVMGIPSGKGPMGARPPAESQSTATAADEAKKSTAESSKAKRKSSSSNSSEDDDPPPPDGPPPDGPPPGGGGPPAGMGGPPMNFF